MEITIRVPDEIAEQLGDIENMPRHILEAFAIESYRSESITRHQVGQLLGLDYWETETFLARHDAKQRYTIADLEVDRACLRKLDEKRGPR